MDPLEEAQGIINSLESDLENTRKLWKGIEADNPHFEVVSDKNWLERRARMWLHGSTDFWEANELERWFFDNPPLKGIANKDALECVCQWRKWLEEEDAYYEPFEEFEIEKPLAHETLFRFIERMARLVEEEGQGARLEWRALKSFLHYIRQQNSEEAAFIEQIFPQKMDVCHEKILRVIPPEVYPIPQEMACKILIQLARMSREGRRDSQHTALEALGLCWLCLTVSRLRLPVYLEDLSAINIAAIRTDGEYPILKAPTWFGVRPIRISSRVATYLQALYRIPSKKHKKSILQRQLRSLRRPFDTALQRSMTDPSFGNITYTSLLSTPHLFGHHRPGHNILIVSQ